MDYNKIHRNIGELSGIVNKLEHIQEILSFESSDDITAEEAIHDIRHTLKCENEFIPTSSVKEGYIVPFPIPSSCSMCPFSACAWSIPWYSTDERRGRKCLYCQLDSEHSPLELDFHDVTSKAEWCPLIKVGDIHDE